MSGRSVPASAAPRAAMTFRSFSLCAFWSDGSWLNAVLESAREALLKDAAGG